MNKMEAIQEHAGMIEAIADQLLDDHVEVMNENAALRAENERLREAIRWLAAESSIIVFHDRLCQELCDDCGGALAHSPHTALVKECLTVQVQPEEVK